MKNQFTPEQWAEAIINSNIVLWAEATLNNPTDPRKPLKLWPLQKKVLSYQPIKVGDLWTQRKKVIRAGRGVGKCRCINDYVTLATGQRITFQKLLDRNPLDKIHSEKNKLLISDIVGNILISNNYKIFYNGKRNVYKLTTKTGTQETSTINHKYLLYNQYGIEEVPLEDIKPGDKILNTRYMPIFGNTIKNVILSPETIDEYFTLDINLFKIGLQEFILSNTNYNDKYKSIIINNRDNDFLYKLKILLTRLGIISFKTKNFLKINGYYVKALFDTLDLSSHPQIKSIMKLLPQTSDFDILNNMFLDEVKSIEYAGNVDTVDLTIEDTHILLSDMPSHNSVSLVVDALYHALTISYFKIVIVCPHESHVKVVLEHLKSMIDDSNIKMRTISESQKPFYSRVFENGSSIKVYTSGSGGARAGVSIRGVSADKLYSDEMDYLDDKSITAFLPILSRTPHTSLTASSTPTGKQGAFYKWCTDKSLGFQEFHMPSSSAPNWTSDNEKTYRATMSALDYLHEFDAEFGEKEDGVFKRRYLYGEWCDEKKDWDIIPAIIDFKEYYGVSYKELKYNPMNKYFLGIDWNGEAKGTHYVILEWTGKELRTFKILVQANQKFHEKKSMENVITLNSLYNPTKIYCDEGYGATKKDLLLDYAIKNPGSRLKERLEFYDFNSKREFWSPTKKIKEKKTVKPFMVNITVLLLERGLLKIDKSLDTNPNDLGQQIVNYQVLISQNNRPVYHRAGQGGYDHTTDAWMLACLAFSEIVDFYKKPIFNQFLGHKAIYPKQEKISKKNTHRRSYPITWGNVSRRLPPGGSRQF